MTDPRTDGGTDKPSYRDPRTLLKRKVHNLVEFHFGMKKINSNMATEENRQKGSGVIHDGGMSPRAVVMEVEEARSSP